MAEDLQPYRAPELLGRPVEAAAAPAGSPLAETDGAAPPGATGAAKLTGKKKTKKAKSATKKRPIIQSPALQPRPAVTQPPLSAHSASMFSGYARDPELRSLHRPPSDSLSPRLRNTRVAWSERRQASQPKHEPKSHPRPAQPRSSTANGRSSLAAPPQPRDIDRLMQGTIGEVTSRLHGLDGTTLLLMLVYEREHKDRKSLKKQLFRVRQTC
eukprot:COSAG06_NODE_4791_length_3950_cov_18.021240_5_plen_213_part_00